MARVRIGPASSSDRKALDALQAYLEGGGNLAYLGGNGFYWRVAHVSELPHVIELRRAEGGIRAWAAEPGEYYHALDGGYGGCGCETDAPAQKLVGVGFSSQGKFEATYYRKPTRESTRTTLRSSMVSKATSLAITVSRGAEQPATKWTVRTKLSERRRMPSFSRDRRILRPARPMSMRICWGRFEQ